MRLKIFLLCFFLALNSFAQTHEQFKNLDKEIKDAFTSLDKNRVITGFLSDYSLELVSLKDYSGHLTDSNYVSFETLKMISETMQSASVTGMTVKQISSCIPSLSATFRNHYMPISIAAYKYNSFREDALTAGLINYDGVNVSDKYINGMWVDPYEYNTLFGFSPYMNVVSDGHLTFSFKNDWISTNIDDSISFEFDAGDGHGYRTVRNGSAISVNYEVGQHVLRMRMQIREKEAIEIRESHSYITVISSQAINRAPASIITPDFTKTFVGDLTPGYAFTSSADISILYAEGRTSLRKPLLVVEGFDPLAGISEYETTLSSFMDNIPSSRFDISEYDIVYVDWKDSFAPIQANASVLKKIIAWVRDNTDADGGKCVLLAESMGGLVARYALCDMERHEEHHNVATYISVDSPYLGVNVPLGAVYGVQHLFEMLEDANESFLVDMFLSLTGSYEKAKTAYNSALHMKDAPSIRQMLCNYVNSNYVLDNTMFNELQEEFLDMGFPKGDDGHSLVRLAISNGGNNTVNTIDKFLSIEARASMSELSSIAMDLLFFPGLILNTIDVSLLGVVGILPGNRSIMFECYIYPYISPNSLIYEDQLRYRKKGLIWRKTKTLFKHSDYSPQTGIPMDYVNGSLYSLEKKPLSNSGGIKHIGSYSLSADYTEKIVFVPTVSSICYQNGRFSESDYNRSFSSSNLNISNTPFDACYLNSVASEHIDISCDMWSWLDDMINLYAEGPDMGLRMEGPNLLNESASYTVISNLDIPYDYSVEWSSSDPSVVNVEKHNGRATLVKKGVAEIRALVKVNGRKVSLSKKIQVGLPDYVIQFDKYFIDKEGLQYAIALPIQDVLPEIKADISYQWGLVGVDGNIVWYNVTYDSIYHFSVSPSNNQRIYLRVLYQDVTYQMLSTICGCLPDTIILTKGHKYGMILPSKSQIIMLIPDISISSSSDIDTQAPYEICLYGDVFRFDHLPTLTEILEPSSKDVLLEHFTFYSELYEAVNNKNKENVYVNYTLTNKDTGEVIDGTLRFIWKEKINDIL